MGKETDPLVHLQEQLRDAKLHQFSESRALDDFITSGGSYPLDQLERGIADSHAALKLIRQEISELSRKVAKVHVARLMDELQDKTPDRVRDRLRIMQQDGILQTSGTNFFYAVPGDLRLYLAEQVFGDKHKGVEVTTTQDFGQRQYHVYGKNAKPGSPGLMIMRTEVNKGKEGILFIGLEIAGANKKTGAKAGAGRRR